MTKIKFSSPDLTKFPPRSPRVQLGGYVHLPRLIDKARATLAGRAGDYKYNCALDGHFFAFTRIKPKLFLAAVKRARSDTEVLAWVRKTSRRLPSEVASWSGWLTARGPGGVGGHEWFGECVKAAAKNRDDIHGFFDLLDMDDYASFGGRP